MKISVIIPTNRPSGALFGFQLPSLADQTMSKTEWELILVDDYIPSREEEVRKYADEHGMNIKWMRSKPSHYRTNAPISSVRNTGLIHAEGELIVFMDDYIWVRPKYLETIWSNYDPINGYSVIGAATAIEYPEPPIPKDLSTLEIRHDDRIPSNFWSFLTPIDWRKDWRETRKNIEGECPGSWFFTCNASAPLDQMIQVNGFWEIADLCREEDILMGLALERIGWRFRFLSIPDATVYHAPHSRPEDIGYPKKRYKLVTYEQIGWGPGELNGHPVLGVKGPGKCGLDTGSDEIQLLTKDIFDTAHPGSWALIEHFKTNRDLTRFNDEIGFDLREERI